MTAAREYTLEVNRIRLHLREQGEGPLVLLCHGFPETSLVWRHQLQALAEAGFRAVAPDLRGYGGSDSPPDVGAFTTLDVLGDLIALLDVLGEREAVIVGGDWGATVAWQAAQLRPDRFRAVVALGVPLMGRAPMLPSLLFPRTETALFYTHYFSEPGVAEREFERDVGKTLRRIYFAASGEAGPREDARTPNPFGMVSRDDGLLAALPDPDQLPAWLAAADLAAMVASFERSGFRGGLNYYRNLDRNWALQAAFDGLKVEVPALHLIGERDAGRVMPGMDRIIEAMPALAPRLTASQVIAGAGHWLQQEAPEAVNAALLGFLRGL
ncbi:alpha/beta fold hydrolase [Roseateles chitinivorans]|uniref:alpha/beta fold hydrolase n=1 Tax=Roseateles chitinivorans TaxID=2917965 RepID=UPI003D675CD9